MTTRDDFESYLIRLNVDLEEIEEGMWVIHGADGAPDVVIHLSPPLVLMRLKVMDLPDGAGDAALAALYRRLLELNATDIVHGSYGIEEGDVVLTDAMDLDTLDFDELRTSYESIVYAATSHTPRIAELAPAAS